MASLPFGSHPIPHGVDATSSSNDMSDLAFGDCHQSSGRVRSAADSQRNDHDSSEESILSKGALRSFVFEAISAQLEKKIRAYAREHAKSYSRQFISDFFDSDAFKSCFRMYAEARLPTTPLHAVEPSSHRVKSSASRSSSSKRIVPEHSSHRRSRSSIFFR